MSIFKRSLLTTFTALSLVCGGTASAAIIFELGNNPQANQENIVFNGAGTISGPAFTVTGRTNQSDTIVAFTSNENLITPSSGQARVDAEDGAFRLLDVYLQNGGTFQSLIFNLNTPNSLTGSALITVDRVVGPDATFTLDLTNGQNFLTIYATEGDLIKNVNINSNTGLSMIDIDDGRQFRISGMAPPVNVPEPTALWLMGIGLLGLGMTKRRKT